MKKINSQKKNRKARKKVARTFVTILTLTALAFNMIPLPNISFISEKLANIKVVHAADDYDTNPTLQTIQNIIDYSKAYNEYAENHQFDNITIAISTGISDAEFTGFIPIGTEEKPFGGTITIDISSTHVMNLDCAFFDYVYDYAEIKTSSGKHMIIATTNDHTDAVFANHVVHDDQVTYSDTRSALNARMINDFSEDTVVETIEDETEVKESPEEETSENKNQTKEESSDEEEQTSEVSSEEQQEVPEEEESDESSEDISGQNDEKNSEESEDGSEDTNEDTGSESTDDTSETTEDISGHNEKENSEETIEDEGTTGENSEAESNSEAALEVPVEEDNNGGAEVPTEDNVESASNKSSGGSRLDASGDTVDNNATIGVDNSFTEELLDTDAKLDTETSDPSVQYNYPEAEQKDAPADDSIDGKTEIGTDETAENTGVVENTEENSEKEYSEENSEKSSDDINQEDSEEDNENDSEFAKEEESTTDPEDGVSDENDSEDSSDGINQEDSEEDNDDNSEITEEEITSDSDIDASGEEESKEKKTVTLSKVVAKLLNLRGTANGVTPRPETVVYAHWIIEVTDYKGDVHEHGSLIGEIKDEAKVTVTLINNSTGKYKSDQNTGMICGTVGTDDGGAILIVDGVSGSVSDIVSEDGSAGGFVGELKPESELTLSGVSGNISHIYNNVTATDYAGGIAGINNQAVFNPGAYNSVIVNSISGTNGAGGIFGYYCPAVEDESDAVNLLFDLNTIPYSIGSSSSRCKVGSGSGYAGGLFGVLNNLGGEITIQGTNAKPIYVQGKGKNFGGLIGDYQADSIEDSLFIQGTAANSRITVDASRSGDLTNYGGFIGVVGGKENVNDSGFVSVKYASAEISYPNTGCFGGVVARADNAYIYVNTFKLKTIGEGYFGGGIIGHMQEGVVHLAGTTDFSQALAKDGNNNCGQVVGYRDKAFVFAESGWDFTRNSTTDVSLDDIASWGEVVRFKGTGSGYVIGNVLDGYYDSSAATPVHYVTIKGVSFNGDGAILLSGKESYARAALNLQLNNGTSGDVLKFSGVETDSYDSLKEKNVVMSADIDLSHTGMTGLTRDNWISSWPSGIRPDFYGEEFDGGNHTLTLAIGEPYEGTDSSSYATDMTGKGKIYRHRFNGLFGAVSGDEFTVKDVKINGKVHTFALSDVTPFYIGTIAGNIANTLVAQNVFVKTDTSIIYGTTDPDDELYVGGLVGKISNPGNTVIGSDSYTGETNCTFGADLKGNAVSSKCYAGGVAGFVGSGGNISVNDVKLTNASGKAIKNTAAKDAQKMGGLFGVISDGNNTLDLDGVEIDGLTISGKMTAKGSMGGLLGYSWEGVAATFDHISVKNSALSNESTVTNGNMAGLVYLGSGAWQFKEVIVGGESDNGISLSGTQVSSFGMLVNKAGNGNKAMYLLLPQNYIYKLQGITNSGLINASTVYDEIAAYSRMGDTPIEENGNSVVSINTCGETKYGSCTDTVVNMDSGTTCNTYQNQVTISGFNPYNPNTRYYYNIDNYKNFIPNRDQNKILYIYSVKQYAHSSIKNHFTANFNALTLTKNTNIDMKGISYYPFDVTDESISGLAGKITLYNEVIEQRETDSLGDDYARTTLKDTTNNTTTQHYLMHAGLFRNVTKTINITDTLTLKGTVPVVDDYSGALVCGSINGNLEGDAVVDSSRGSILLNGIKIYNKNDTYSPLLINKVSEYTDIKIYNVSASAYGTGDTIATSLIGNAGFETAKSVKISFSGIKLDGRTTDNTEEGNLTNVYNTSHSLFTKATLLESLSYATGTGSSGIYNYEYDEDWDGSREVTYGYEISDSNSVNAGKEYYYYRDFGKSNRFTNPKEDSETAGRTSVYPFTKFLPYVYVSGNRITNTSTQHQLDVNHASATFGGCGTYNHPYTIAFDPDDENSAVDGGLQTIANIISKQSLPGSGFKISLPDDITTPATWCEGKNSCKEYEFNGSDTFVYTADTSYNKTLDSVVKYLAGAYYEIKTDIYLENRFQGLGNSDVDDGIFHGVIVSNGYTIVNYSDQPLVYASNGCVIKNVKIKPEVSVQLTEKNREKFASSGGCGAYGAVIGRVFGGDNIIDQVMIDLTQCTISKKTELTPVGGYIGVIESGGVFFRNMNLVSDSLKTGFTGGNYAEDDYSYLYCNPLIGRVIEGFAVNETSVYAPYENGSRKLADNTSVSGNRVSLRNGNKNYSITDINPTNTSKLTVSGTTITIPDSQAFYVMSLIVNCGMGTGGSYVKGYYGTNQKTRHAKYNYVGTDKPITATETEDIIDYNKAANDNTTNPYLIEQYTTVNNVKTLGTNTFTLNLSNDIILPDGYKGIGNIFTDNDSLKMTLSTFNGNNKTISQNTTFNSYKSTKDNYLPYVTIMRVDNKDQEKVHGLGLFNYIKNATFKNCKLTGNVLARQYDGGKALVYTKPADGTGLATGMLAGTLKMGNNATITDIYLQNVYSESTREAGGMIGFLINAGKKLTVVNTENNSGNSEKIYVNGGTCAGGLIARQGDDVASTSKGEGSISIDFNGHYFNYSSVVSRFNDDLSTSNTAVWNSDWAYGVGGLIGITRNGTDKNATKNFIDINDVNVGSSGDTGVVACEYTDANNNIVQGKVYAGGLVGVANKAPVKATNCNIYNVSVRSANYSGGVLGWGGTWSNITLDGFNIINTHDAEIYTSSNSGKSGCVVGFCKGGDDNNSMGTLKMINSTIEGYTIEGNDAGGAMGDWNSSKPFTLINSEIKNCTILYRNSGGGIAGMLQQSLNGYNVRVSDISFGESSGRRGYIVGNRTGTIKMVGFHRTGNITLDKLIGSAANNKMSSLFGNEGYVVFADYMGSSLEGGNRTASELPYAVPPVSNLASSPFITVNPALTLDSNINLITSDGINTEARDSILNDIVTGTSYKRYQVEDPDKTKYLIENGEINTNYVSSFSKELGAVIKDKSYDFPMLVVNDTTTADAVVNEYLGYLTNTTLDFSKNISGKYVVNTSNANVGVVSIKKCEYSNGTFTLSDDASLVVENDLFKIRKTNGQEQYDTTNPNGQFTLIDVAFKAPNETDNAAYHLYVPVYVKKLLEYSFDVAVVSGTSYDRTIYENNYGNTMIENLGTPITMEFKYTYFRTAQEWEKEGEGATDYNYAKKLKFTNLSEGVFDSSTKMVLVDANNGGKVYYLDTLSTGLSGGVLDLSKFKASDGSTPFSPVNITALPTNSSGYKEETYYLSIFTNKTENLLFHYEITSMPLDDNPNKPTRRVDCKCPDKGKDDYHYVIHILMGDFYDNYIQVSTLTENQEMSASNYSVTATLTATVGLKESAKAMLINYLGNSKIHIYQTLLASFAKYDKDDNRTGQDVSFLDYATVNSYTITQGQDIDRISESPITDNPSFVEFPNNTDIKSKLSKGNVIIEANVTLSYTNEAHREGEFPYRNTSDTDDVAGALLVGYSNISSIKETAAYSTISDNRGDINSRRYYIAAEADAVLNYNASYEVRLGDSKYLTDNQLGINGLEMMAGELAEMHSIGIYDVSSLSKVDGSKYILCELELYQRDSNTSEDYKTQAEAIATYINGINLCSDDSSDVIVKAKSESGNKYYYVLDIDTVAKDADKVYSIPIDFWVKNGSDLETGGLQYCNYKLKLTTTLLTDYDISTGTPTFAGGDRTKSEAVDYIIYTNSKIFTDHMR